jgi:hypothetical protein
MTHIDSVLRFILLGCPLFASTFAMEIKNVNPSSNNYQIKTIPLNDEYSEPKRYTDLGTRSLALEGRWNISIPELFTCDGSEFIFRFTISDLIANDMIGYELMRGDMCDINITTNDYLVAQMAYDSTPQGDGNQEREVALVLTPDTDIIDQTPIYTPNANGYSGTLAWCMRLILYTADGNIMVNWRDVSFQMAATFQAGIRRERILEDTSFQAGIRRGRTLEDTTTTTMEPARDHESRESQSNRRLSLDCTTEEGFGIIFNSTYLELFNETTGSNVTTTNTTEEEGFGGILLTPTDVYGMNEEGGQGSNQDSSDAFLVDAFECDDENMPVTENNQAQRRQGSTVKICVVPKERAIELGLRMRSIDSFYFAKADTAVIQYAVENGELDFYGMSEMTCIKGSDLCWFESILRAEYYATSGEVYGSGFASLQFGTQSSRERQLSMAPRALQERQRTGFKVSFPVLSHQAQMLLKAEIISQEQTIALGTLSSVFLAILAALCWIRSKRSRKMMDGDGVAKEGQQADCIATDGDCHFSEGGTADIDLSYIHDPANMMTIDEEK